MDDWGFDGPTIFGVVSVESTYSEVTTIHFNSVAACQAAGRAVGWAEWDEQTLELPINDGLIETREPSRQFVPVYYGKWALADEFAYTDALLDELDTARRCLNRIGACIKPVLDLTEQA